MTATWTTPRTWSSELVTSTMMNAHVRDNMDYLAARPLLDVSDLDGTVSNTSSTSFADITGASGNITSSTGRIYIIGTLVVSGNGANVSVYTVRVGGSDVGNATYGLGFIQSTATWNAITVIHIATVTANAATTIKLRHRVSGGTSTVALFNLKVMEY